MAVAARSAPRLVRQQPLGYKRTLSTLISPAVLDGKVTMRPDGSLFA